MKKVLLLLVSLSFIYSVNAQKFVWDKLNSGISSGNLYDIKFVNDSVGMAIGNDGSINFVLKTTDGGLNWNNVATASIDQLVRACDFVDVNNVFIVGRKGGLYKSFDGGQSWSKLNLGTNVDLIDISSPDAKAIYICTAGGRYINYDGVGWATKTVYSADDFVAVGFPTKNEGFLTATNGRVWRTSDGGDTWDTVKTDQESILGSHFITYNVGYVVGGKGMVKRTINGGINWSDTLIYPEDYKNIDFRAVSFPLQNFGFIGGNNGTILRTADGGSNWIQEITNITDKIYKIDAPSITSAFAVGENGIILKRRDASSIHENDFNTINIYPNPATSVLHIVHTVTHEQAQISIYNLNGKEVLHSTLTKGNNHQLDISGLTQGLYLIKLLSDESSSWGKVLIK